MPYMANNEINFHLIIFKKPFAGYIESAEYFPISSVIFAE